MVSLVSSTRNGRNSFGVRCRTAYFDILGTEVLEVVVYNLFFADNVTILKHVLYEGRKYVI